MIERITDMPAGTIGFRVSGDVTAEDYRKLGFDAGVRHHHAWKRSAVVTDIGWMVRSIRVFGWMVPGEARVFELARLDEAKDWVAGS